MSRLKKLMKKIDNIINKITIEEINKRIKLDEEGQKSDGMINTMELYIYGDEKYDK